ncbi:MAG: GntR family transcriptional regulator [Clostridiales bacterium]|nr:MAG: GntR family transcriptional regulator [Clostridiales bacterium]
MNTGAGKLKLQNYKPLREVVFEYLRSAILNGEFKPGERLMELQMGEQLGVSRTPIREAIRKLELEGLVTMIPRKGAYVADMSIKDVLDVLEVREVLEGLASYLAAERRGDGELELLEKVLSEFEGYVNASDREGMMEKDKAFHEAIFASTHNKKLIQIAQGLQEQVQRFRVVFFSESDDFKQLLSEHREILDAIRAGKGEAARAKAENHIRDMEETIRIFRKKKKNIY